jgi:hypothetical protein
MKKNVGNLDKSIRITLAIFIFAAGLYFGSWWGLAGFIPLLTGLVNTCPLYACTGLNTLTLKK